MKQIKQFFGILLIFGKLEKLERVEQQVNRNTA